MNLSAPFIQRPIMTLLAMIALFVAGVMSYVNLPISSMPDVTYPVISVKVSFPGALPETMGNSVALPLEKQFMGIPGLRLVSSSSILGSTNIVLQFEIDKDMTTAAQEVQEAITNALPYLPPGLPYGPTYRKVNPAEQPIMYLALTSETLPRSDLYTYGNTLIGQRISMIEGVSQVSVYGSVLAVRVQVDPAALSAKDITLNELANAISLNNAFIATGQLDGTVEAPIINVDGQLMTAPDYESLIVAYRNGTPVRISDIGRAVESFQNLKVNNQYYASETPQASLTLAIQKEPTANTVAIANAIYKLLDELQADMPPAIDIHVVFDRSIPVRESIRDAIMTLIFAFFLVVLVIYLFMGKLVDTIIPAIVLPMSVISTFIFMHLMGYSLNSLSVLALTLAIGFIVDDAVVVMENISRRVEGGEAPMRAAMEGSRQISFTIVSMSMSLIAVFIPMLFMGGLIGKIFSEFALTLTAITVISGFISLTLTPMLSSRFIPPIDKKNYRLAHWSNHINQYMQEKYRTMLVRVLHHQWTAAIVAFVCTIATVWLFIYLPTDFVPDEDLGFFVIYTEEREGGSSYDLLKKEEMLSKLLMKNPAVEHVVSISSFSEYRKGLNLVRLKPVSKRLPIQKVIQQVYLDIKKVDGLKGYIKNIPLIDLSTGQQSRAAYQFALHSVFSDRIYPSARRLIERMQKDPLFQGVNSDLELDTPQINVKILRDQASRLGISPTEIEKAFSYSYSGNFISRIQSPIDQYYVILELFPEYQQQIDTLNNIWLRSSTSKSLVPLSTTVSIEQKLGASSINHINQFPAVTISFNLAPGVPLEKALDRINSYTKQLVEPGVSAHSIGAAQTFQESIKNAGYLLILTIFFIYIILGILYESFIHPITILTTLPPAVFGGLLTLLIFGLPLSMYSYLGIILLIGIVKKNGIMMIDFAIENIRHKKMSPEDAIVDACMIRFRPIMMTTVAAIFGVLPIVFAFGENALSRRPLGLVVIGGLLLAQLITLFITPIIYVIMEQMKTKWTKRVRRTV